MHGNAVARAAGAPDFDLDIFCLVTRALAACAIFYICFAYRDNTRSHYFSEYEFLTGETRGNRNSGNLPFWGRDTKRNLPPKKLNSRQVATHLLLTFVSFAERLESPPGNRPPIW
jgi:hypothetical protein